MPMATMTAIQVAGRNIISRAMPPLSRREVEEESTEQQEHHSSSRDEAELPVSGGLLAQSMRLATHPPKQEGR